MKILAIAFTFPPLNYPRSTQVARLLKHLRASTVLVCAEDDRSLMDSTLEPDAEACLERCLRIPASRPRWRRMADALAQRADLPVWNKAPDEHGGWKKSVIEAVNRSVIGGCYRPDLLVTFGNPMTDHLIGLELSRRHRLPWAAHFSDPWADNPLNRYDPLTRAMNLALERKVIEAADRVVFTSRETVDLVMAKYPEPWRAKARVLPHSFDPKLYTTAPPGGDSDLTVRHIGTFYKHRTPRPLFQALSRLLDSDPTALRGVRFELIGNVNLTEMLKDTGYERLPEGLVRVKSLVGHRESLELMSSSDGLVVIDAPADESVFLPSKLIEYVGAARPILGLTPPGAAASLIRRLGGWAAHPLDEEAVTTALKSFLEHLRGRRSRRGEPWGEPVVRDEYEASAVARAFEEIARELLAEVRRPSGSVVA